MKIAVIIGSSRSDGNTVDLVNRFSRAINNQVSVYNLSNYDIKPYDYHFNNRADDFASLIAEIVKQHDFIMFASPVYWYSPSAQLKVFMDRLSDLLEVNKPLGRLLKNKLAGVISTGSDVKPKQCFESVFECTFNYLQLKYIGMLYGSYDDSLSDDKQIDFAISKYLQKSVFVEG